MLIDVRRVDVPALHASHEHAVVRTPHLRLGWFRSQRIVTDFGLLGRAMPFGHHLNRATLTILLEGQGRFEEHGVRGYLAPAQFVVSDQRRRGTEAYCGESCSYLLLEWEPGVHGAPFAHPFAIERLGPRDYARIERAARLVGGPESVRAIVEVLDVLRGVGLGIDRVDPRELEADPPEEIKPLQPLFNVVSEKLSSLHELPTIEDLAQALGWNQRQIHRRMASLRETYNLSWTHWREAVHQARMLHAMRLLGVPGATTELVARLSGFRAPAALCHAFAKAGLPSPMRLARAAQRDALAEWSSFVDGPAPQIDREAPPSHRAA